MFNFDQRRVSSMTSRSGVRLGCVIYTWLGKLFIAGAVLALLGDPAHPRTQQGLEQQPQRIPKAAVIPRLTCSGDSAQSYALYLPSGYKEDTRWPILYCFDPGAEGGIPVQAFKEGAEKYGYIVVGSNNSKNGPMAIASAAINAVWNDTHARFNIDDNRIYATGFSGGARVACQFGYALAGKVAGVIACGAGFPTNITPSRSTPFAVFATVGIEDFNYPEMIRLARTLDSAGVANKLRIFDGPHQWAPKEICTESIEWMQLQAMRSGRLEKDNSFIDGLFDRELAAGRASEAQAKTYEAYLAYEGLVKDFKGIKDVAVPEKKAADLRNSKQVKEALRQEKDQIDKQEARVRELEALKRTALGRSRVDPTESSRDAGVSRAVESSEDRAAALTDLKKAIAGLRKKADESSPDQLVWRRVLQGFLVECYETAESLRQSGNYALALGNLQIAAEVRPESRGIFYNLACVYSRLSEKGKALAALKRAVDNGYSDLHSLETDPDLDAIRAEPEFRRIVADLGNRKPQ
jgi:tetratricopeptide (TPR) repeat protein